MYLSVKKQPDAYTSVLLQGWPHSYLIDPIDFALFSGNLGKLFPFLHHAYRSAAAAGEPPPATTLAESGGAVRDERAGGEGVC
jgi:hypothetical protein